MSNTITSRSPNRGPRIARLRERASAWSLGAERASFWVLLAVAAVNVVLGVWRPRLTQLPD